MSTVYCDESGFTGENLWQEDQPYFVYAAVAVSAEEALEKVSQIRQDYPIKAPELHAAQLLRRESGKRAVIKIVESLVPQSSVVVFHKRYSLAAKMFEFLIEPAISQMNSLFYDIGFHKFVANGLYVSQLCEPSGTGQVCVAFQEFMRTADLRHLESMIGEGLQDGVTGLLGQISTFAICNRQAIQAEIGANESGNRLPSWLLELTASGLTSLLARVSGKDMLPLSVVCDESRPLLTQADMFNGFIGRTDCQTMEVDGRTSQVTFNLAQEIRFDSSKVTPGLQLADLVAGAAAFAFKWPDDHFSHKWRAICGRTLHASSMFPEPNEFDVTTERAVANMFVWSELLERSIKGQNLLSGMQEFIRFAQESASQFLAMRGASVPG